MRAAFRTGAFTALALLAGGCMSGPLVDNPVRIAPSADACANPVYLPHGPGAYGLVFEQVLDVIDDYFPDIAYANRYDGRIETFPRIAPGLEQPWKPGSPDFPQRLLATFQTIRHRAVVLITPADDGGFFVDVKVYKELEDLARPTRSTAGSAAFRSDNTVERQFEVIDASVVDANWIPIGQDVRLEQKILCRLAFFDVHTPGPVVAPAPAPAPQPAAPPALAVPGPPAAPRP
jgi:hypothetical protein